jgi:membrane protease subunit (stomatin/prohibitin family)
MSLGSFLRKQFIEVIQWTEAGPGVLAYRFPTADMEIKNGAVLTVRESQAAVFINEGKVADNFLPGKYQLTTQTLPILTYLKNWDKAFESPFKSDVYFFSLREQTDQKWGTPTPITLRDKEFGMVRIRANGIYSYKIKDIEPFWTKLSGTTEQYTVQDIEGQLRSTVLTALASALGGSAIAFIDMAANQSAFSEKLKAAVAPAFAEYGLELKTFLVQSLSLPEELEQHLDKVASMGMAGDLKRYTQFQAADSLSVAAANPGGIAGAGAGLGAGIAMGQMMAGAMSGAGVGNSGAAALASDPVAMLQKLSELLKSGILTQAEFDAKKTELLQQIK